MSGPRVILATHADGSLRMFTKSEEGGIEQVGQLVAQSLPPDTMVTLVSDLSGVLGWEHQTEPSPVARGQARALPAPDPEPESEEALSLTALTTQLRTHPAILAYHAPVPPSKKRGENIEPRRSKHVVRAAVITVIASMPERRGTASQIATILRGRDGNIRHCLERLAGEGLVEKRTIRHGARETLVWRLL